MCLVESRGLDHPGWPRDPSSTCLASACSSWALASGGEPWQSLGEGQPCPVLGGHRSLLGRPGQHTCMRSAWGPHSGVLALATPKCSLLRIRAFPSDNLYSYIIFQSFLFKDSCYKSSLNLDCWLYRADPVLTCLQCVMSFPHPRCSALGPLLSPQSVGALPTHTCCSWPAPSSPGAPPVSCSQLPGGGGAGGSTGAAFSLRSQLLLLLKGKMVLFVFKILTLEETFLKIGRAHV